MEKSKPSEEEIIALGKKIVKELQLEPSVNTLGRWMSHYVAELITQAEESKEDSDKKAKQRECVDVILKLWKNRDHLPNISTPLSGLNGFINLLDVLIKNEHPLPLFRRFMDTSNDGSWLGLVNTVKTSSENILRLSLLSQVNLELLSQKQEYLSQHSSMLSREETEMLGRLEDFVNRSKSLITFSHEKEEEITFKDISPKKRYEAIFNKIEEELTEINQVFDKLKRSTYLALE